MTTVTKLPDEMGVWSEDGEVWLRRDLYPRRSQAIQWAMEQWSCSWTEVRCRSRWMRYEPRIVQPFIYDNGRHDPGYTEDLWWECDKGDPDAFRVWRLEAA